MSSHFETKNLITNESCDLVFKLLKGCEWEQRVHRESRSSAKHSQRLLEDGCRVRSPSYRHGLQ
jgi:hypothetical protein